MDARSKAAFPDAGGYRLRDPRDRSHHHADQDAEFLSHGALVGLNDLSPLAFRLAITVGVGLIAALLAVILSTDLVPDWWRIFGDRLCWSRWLRGHRLFVVGARLQSFEYALPARSWQAGGSRSSRCRADQGAASSRCVPCQAGASSSSATASTCAASSTTGSRSHAKLEQLHHEP